MAFRDEEDESHQQPKKMKTFYSSQHHHSIPTLPQDIVIHILLRLPVKSLLRCKSVCKSWQYLISDPHFVKSHLTLSTTNNDYVYHRLMLRCCGSYLKSFPLYDVMHDKSINLLKIDHQLEDSKVVGYCNGLLCIKVKGDAIVLWNPSTKRSNRLPYPSLKSRFYSCRHNLYGFGYDESSGDYKVVIVGAKVKIYSLKSGKWKNIGGFPDRLFLVGYCCKFLNGALHWVAASESDSSYTRTIVSLDLTTETYDIVKQPVYDEGYTYLTIEVVGECLSLLYAYGGNHVDVWVMKVYGLQDSWTKLASVKDLTKFRTDYCSTYPTVCFANDEKILFEYNWKLVLYDVKNDMFSEIKTHDRCFQADIFVESLVSPDGPRRRSKRLG